MDADHAGFLYENKIQPSCLLFASIFLRLLILLLSLVRDSNFFAQVTSLSN